MGASEGTTSIIFPSGLRWRNNSANSQHASRGRVVPKINTFVCSGVELPSCLLLG
jgi:hypothetical protein